MKRSQKISAFTLTEILVVLVISTIVVGFAFTVLDLVQRNLSAIKSNYLTNIELQHLEQQLTLDFNRFHSIEYEEGLLELKLRTPLDSVIFSKAEGRLVRNLDTIPVPLKEVEMYYEGNRITTGKVDAIKIILDMPEGRFLFISKENSAKTFFE